MKNQYSELASYTLFGIFLSWALLGLIGNNEKLLLWRRGNSASRLSPQRQEQVLLERLEQCAHQLEDTVLGIFPTTPTNHQQPSSFSTTATSASLSSTSNTAAICAIQKDGLYYIDEWVDYHLALGFQTIYIYDNSDDFELSQWARSRNRDRVVVQHFPGTKQQKPAIHHCVNQQKRTQKHEWLALLDIDEFIVLKKHDSIIKMLEEVVPNNSAGLALNRFAFYFSEENGDNTNNNQTSSTSSNYYYQPLPVTKRFPMRMEWIDPWYKTIARTKSIRRPNVHSHTYFRQQEAIDTNGSNVTDTPSRNDPTGTDAVAIIHHYQTKSLQEFRSKCQRGDAVHGILLPSGGGNGHDNYTYSSRGKKNASSTIATSTTNSIKGNQEACLPESKIIEKYGNSAGTRVFDDSAWRFLQNACPSYRRYTTMEII